MRSSNKSRSRNKSGSNNSSRRNNVGNIINRVFESAGPDGKVRGTPQQIIEKYQALARDAQVSGDRVAAESYLQHAEHYARLLGEAQRHLQDNRPPDARDDREGDDRDDALGRPDAPDRPQPPEHRSEPRAEQRDRRPEQRDPRPEQRDHRPEQREMRAEQRPEHRPEPPTRHPEPSGLTTLGADDGDELGPVETPEEAARRRTEVAEARAPSLPMLNGEHHPSEPRPEGAKRPRTRRKAKAAIQPAEAGAE